VGVGGGGRRKGRRKWRTTNQDTNQHSDKGTNQHSKEFANQHTNEDTNKHTVRQWDITAAIGPGRPQQSNGDSAKARRKGKFILLVVVIIPIPIAILILLFVNCEFWRYIATMFLPGLTKVDMPVEHVQVHGKVHPHMLPSIASLCSHNELSTFPCKENHQSLKVDERIKHYQ
jgi:hypothetical protein